MRKDCTRDNRKTFLPNASHLGFDLWNAKRGNWILYRENESTLRHARVIGGVTADEKRWIEVCAILGNFDCPAVRWIDPESVLQCRESVPREIFHFLSNDAFWQSAETAIGIIEHGFLPQEYVDRKARERIPHKHIGVGFCSVCGHNGDDCTGKRESASCS